MPEASKVHNDSLLVQSILMTSKIDKQKPYSSPDNHADSIRGRARLSLNLHTGYCAMERPGHTRKAGIEYQIRFLET